MTEYAPLRPHVLENLEERATNALPSGTSVRVPSHMLMSLIQEVRALRVSPSEEKE